MATAESPTSTGEVVQAWVSPDLARELKQLAEQERRSVSAVIRLAIEDQPRKEDACDRIRAPASLPK